MMLRLMGAMGCTILWAGLVGCAGPLWGDCPRIQLDARVGVDRLCENTVAGANNVPLFQAIVRMWLGRELPEANALLRQAYRDLLDGAPAMTPELADERAKWQMRLWVRTYFLFNRRNGWYPGRLEPETERLFHELFWNYAWSKSTVDRADPRYVWFIQGSENHDLMDLSNAFLCLRAIRHVPEFKGRRLRDGRTPDDHVRAWTRYYRAYADERVARGLLIECASATYGKYAIPELFNLADFADDPVLRRKMTMLLDVLWADWAVEQLDGVRGGGKSRIYQGNYARLGTHDSYKQMARVLQGEGTWTKGRHGHTNSGFVYCLATSRYRLPKVVHRLFDQDQHPGRYSYISRRPGKMTGVHKMPDYLPHTCWYVMDPEDTRAVRYTYRTPNYVMGSWWVDPRLDQSVIVKDGDYAWGDANYAAIHAQNRWHGIVFRAGPNARIFPQCFTSVPRRQGKESYSVSNHQQIAVQHQNVMITQANLARKDIQAMRVYVPEAIRKSLTEHDGWLIAEVGGAYVAFKGLHPETGAGVQGEWEQKSYYRLADWRAPVIFVAGTARRFGNADRFAEYVTSQNYEVGEQVLTVRFTGADEPLATLTFDLTQRSLPTVDGRPIDLNPPKVYDCPYIQSDFGSGVVRIGLGNQAYVWNMRDNTIRPG